MSASKISLMDAATTPLGGAELVETVQSGANKKTTVADLLTQTLAQLSSRTSDAVIARTDAGQTFTGVQVLSNGFTMGGHTPTDILISSDGASTSDTALVTPGWIDANVGGGASDHGDLDGLADDDHTQYVLVAGTRAVTGAQEFANGTEALPGVRFSAAGAGMSYNVAGRVHISVGGATQIETSTTFSRFAGDLLPKSTTTHDLGGASNRWQDVYGVDLNLSGSITHTGSTVGFFSATPAAQPTGVAVTAAGIHAALVTLGLITA